MTYKIEMLDHGNDSVRQAIFTFLSEHERHALFILGNLKMRLPGSQLYAASEAGHWVGAAGYYPQFKSFVPFSVYPDVTRALARHIVAVHPELEYVNGYAPIAEVAYEELLRSGYQPANAPRQLFMEMTGLPPVQQTEALARQPEGADTQQIAKLIRCLDGTWDETLPITEQEMERAALNALRTVVVADGKIVATASSNGIGIECYQILGVATHPGYRRSGYASAAVAALMRSMAQKGGRHAVLFTTPDNLPAQQCYRRLGFEVTGSFYIAKLKKRNSDERF